MLPPGVSYAAISGESNQWQVPPNLHTLVKAFDQEPDNFCTVAEGHCITPTTMHPVTAALSEILYGDGTPLYPVRAEESYVYLALYYPSGANQTFSLGSLRISMLVSNKEMYMNWLTGKQTSEPTQETSTPTPTSAPVASPAADQAIIIAAGGAQENNTLFPYSNDFTQRMYRLLKMRGYTDEMIIYINPHAPDIEPLDTHLENDKHDFKLFDPESEINQAFAQAASHLQTGQQFILYVHGHARAGYLDITPTYALSVQSLRALLDTLPTGVEQIIILDTAFAGSFIQTLAAPGRTVLSGTDTVNTAWNTQYISFSDILIRSLRQGQTLLQAFTATRLQLSKLSTPLMLQNPWLDDNGDGVFNDEDGNRSANLCLGYCDIAPSLIPEILQTQAVQDISDNSALLWASLDFMPETIRQVRAVLHSPEANMPDYQGLDSVFENITVALSYNVNELRYEAIYEHFCVPGTWEVFYQAQGIDGAWSDIIASRVRQTQTSVSALCQNNASVTILMNQTQYQVGDDFRLDVRVDGQQNVVPYIALILPDGNFLTYRYNGGFSIPNAMLPYRDTLTLNGARSYPLLSFNLPAGLSSGTYEICGVLMKPQTENPLKMEDWLSFSCTGFEL
ncbi:hypothetical protein [Candidatus Venteria ishoeyi]|uniref:Uncharacterized protein n=1 Tax=Candidatus Venteria ishoeyi TaxID=1899563 RepID=A0A1H6FIE7_9GAMM|nr:hypothetical protein [Candidatus Venteria ishoeyi]SEH08896.1 Uncharacterised protein [Candidatus Venteria ishoeyi]